MNIGLPTGLTVEQMFDHFEEVGADLFLVGPLVAHPDHGSIVPIIAGSDGGEPLPFVIRSIDEALGERRRRHVLDAASDRHHFRWIAEFDDLMGFYQAGAAHWPVLRGLVAQLEALEAGGSRA